MNAQIDATLDTDRLIATLHRPVCDLLGCTWPLMAAGMGGVARSEFVSAVTKTGAFGFLGMVREPVALIRKEIERVRQATTGPFGVNLIPAATPSSLLHAQVAACIELEVPVVALFWDVAPQIIQRLRDAGIVVVYQVGSVADARAAEYAGAQVLIVQGEEAGGHVRARQPLHSLLSEIIPITELPVFAAGGITDGADIATTLALGAQGVAMGTALIPTHESFAHEYHKKRIVDVSEDTTVLTDAFHINWPQGARVRVLPNSVTRGNSGDPFQADSMLIGYDEGRPIHLFSTDSPLRSMTGMFESMALYAGTGAPRIRSVISVADRIHQVLVHAAAILDLNGQVSEKTNASAVTRLSEYMRERLITSLNELLEAERARVRLTSEATAEMSASELRRLIVRIHLDGTRWCSMLTAALRSVGATVSRRTGPLHEEGTAVPDMEDRLKLLRDDQDRVASELRTLIPTVKDAAIKAGLIAMLCSHEDTIRHVNNQLATADAAIGTGDRK